MTVNFPEKLVVPTKQAMLRWRYDGWNEFANALTTWDIYTRQPHLWTGRVVRDPLWVLDRHVDLLLDKLGHVDNRVNVKPHRFTIRIHEDLLPLAKKRQEEEHYRSMSAYQVSLMVFALDPDIPAGKGVPHHKLSPLMREPKVIRDAVFHQLAVDFGDPTRKWPHGVTGRIEEIVHQLALRLK